MLESGRVQVAPLISHRYTLDQVADGLKAVRAGETVKAQVIP
jgi:Zn-dependent alcohol dehydrogenase